MRAPTLLIQGENDSLFGLDQADANYRAIRRNGAPVNMVWFAGGHDGGSQETARVESLTTQWLRRWLAPGHPAASAGTGQPGFAVTRVLGFDPSSDQASLGIATASSYPGLAGTRRTLVRLAGPPQLAVSPAGGAPASISVFPGLGPLGQAGLTFDMPGQSAAFTSAPLSSPVQLTGSPTVRVRVSGAPDVTLFAKIYDVDQAGNATLPNQLVSPVRVTGAQAGRVVTIALPAIDHDFSSRAPAAARADHHRLRLRHPVGARRLPGGAGRAGSDHAVRPGADRGQRRGALVGMGGAGRGAGGRRAHRGPRPPPPPAGTPCPSWPASRWRSPG